MKKKIIAILIIAVMALQLSACTFDFEPTCKEDGCTEKEIYDEGYCRYHYYMNAGESILKDIIN